MKKLFLLVPLFVCGLAHADGSLIGGSSPSGGIIAASSTTFTGSTSFTAPVTIASSLTVTGNTGLIGSVNRPLTVSSSGTFTVGLEGDSVADAVPGIYGSGTGSGSNNYGVKGNATGAGTNYAVYATVGSGGAPSYALYGTGTTSNTNALRIINGSGTNQTTNATVTGGNFTVSQNGGTGQTNNGIVTNADTAATNFGIQSTASGGTTSTGGQFSASGATINYGVQITAGPLNMTPIAAPTTGAQGDIWIDSTQQSVMATVSGSSQAVQTNKWTMTVSSSINTTATMGNIISSAAANGVPTSGLSIPPNFLTVGKTLYLVAIGTYTTTGTPNLTVAVLMGSMTVLTSGAVTQVATTGTNVFKLTAMITCTATGGFGSVMATGQTDQNTNTIGITGMDLPSTLTTGLNTTIEQGIRVQITWSSSSASNNLTFTNVFLEVHN